MKRLIQRKLTDPIAMAILEGKIKEGEEIKVSNENGMINILYPTKP